MLETTLMTPTSTSTSPERFSTSISGRRSVALVAAELFIYSGAHVYF